MTPGARAKAPPIGTLPDAYHAWGGQPNRAWARGIAPQGPTWAHDWGPGARSAPGMPIYDRNAATPPRPHENRQTLLLGGVAGVCRPMTPKNRQTPWSRGVAGVIRWFIGSAHPGPDVLSAPPIGGALSFRPPPMRRALSFGGPPIGARCVLSFYYGGPGDPAWLCAAGGGVRDGLWPARSLAGGFDTSRGHRPWPPSRFT